MTYIVYTHDAWGSTNVGSFPTLEQAREVFDALCADRWCNADGTMRGLSLVEEGPGGLRTVATHAFQPRG
jgi:hypothetical protein